MSEEYEFTTDWFSQHQILWDAIIQKNPLHRILEIGSFEGRSTVYLVEQIRKIHDDPIEIVCVDSWQGGVEHDGINFNDVEGRFDRNLQKLVGSTHDLSVWKKKGLSHIALAEILLESDDKFDFIYIDGSHVATDVFLDAALAFRLLRVGGILIFDDYAYGTPELAEDPYNHPHIAINAFMGVYGPKLKLIPFTAKISEEKVVDLRKHLEEENRPPLYQMYLAKISD